MVTPGYNCWPLRHPPFILCLTDIVNSSLTLIPGSLQHSPFTVFASLPSKQSWNPEIWDHFKTPLSSSLLISFSLRACWFSSCPHVSLICSLLRCLRPSPWSCAESQTSSVWMHLCSRPICALQPEWPPCFLFPLSLPLSTQSLGARHTDSLSILCSSQLQSLGPWHYHCLECLSSLLFLASILSFKPHLKHHLLRRPSLTQQTRSDLPLRSFADSPVLSVSDL